MVARQFGTAAVTFDDRYEPIFVTTWQGLTTIEAAKWGLEQQGLVAAELARRGRRMVAVSDATGVEGATPEVRRYFAQHADTLARTNGDTLLASYVVLANPLVRGVFTAVGWLSETARRVRTAATVSEALERALADLDAAGIPRPTRLDPATYRKPDDVRARVG